MAVRFHHDFETFSEADLLKVGGSRYSRHESTELLMMAYAEDDRPVKQWVPAESIGPRSFYRSTAQYQAALRKDMPREIAEAVKDPNHYFFAWNKSFEYQIWLNTMGVEIPHNRWRDPMVLAYTLSFPGKLDKVGEIVGLPEELRKLAGMALINKFSKPRKPTATISRTRNLPEHFPTDWAMYRAYNRRDVEAERAIWLKLRKWNMPAHEWALWALDQEINEAGIPINVRVARNAVSIAEKVVGDRTNEMRHITGLENPNSGAQLLPWLQTNGYPYEDLKKGHVKRALKLAQEEADDPFDDRGDDETDKQYRRVLQLRTEVARSSSKKFQSLLDAVDIVDEETLSGVVRHCFQFAGAQRTWRWGGRRFQPQNLARPEPYLEKQVHKLVDLVEWLDAESLAFLYEFPMDVLAACVRPVVQAPPGFVFLDADLNAIENRVLGWMTGCQKILRVFREGRCPYVDFATYLYKESYGELYHEYKVLGDKTKRTVAKPGVLGCGYMLSAGDEYENEKTGEMEATGLLGYAWNMGVQLTHEQSAHSVEVFRETFHEVPQYWKEIDKAARRTIATGRPHEAGPVTFDRSGPFMRMRLPSGRYLHYYNPRLEMRRMPWGEMRRSIVYKGLNEKKQWVDVTTHPGKLTENADQAISRDLLANGMLLARKEGLDVRIHVHDQLLALARQEEAEELMKLLIQCMENVPGWSKGLPLGAEGHIDRIFRKD